MPKKLQRSTTHPSVPTSGWLTGFFLVVFVASFLATPTEGQEPPPGDAPGETRSVVEPEFREVGRREQLEGAVEEAEALAGSARVRLAEMRRASAAEIAARRDELDLDRQRFDALETLPPGDPKRSAEADRLFTDLRRLVDSLRRFAVASGEDAFAARREVVEIRSDAAERRRELGLLERAEPASTVGELALRGHGALEARLDAIRQLAALAETRRDEALDLLRRAKELRRKVEEHASAEAREADEHFFLQDLAAETRLVGPQLQAFTRYRRRTLEELPSHVTDWPFVRSVLWAGLWVFLAFLVWSGLRRRLSGWTRGVLRFWAHHDPRYVHEDLTSLEAPAAAAFTAFLDLTFGLTLLAFLGGAVPEIGLVVGVFLYLSLRRAILRSTALLLAPNPEVRPALATVSSTAHALAQRTVNHFALGFILLWLLGYLAVKFFAAVTFAELFHDVFYLLVLPILGVWLFAAWEPLVRRRLRRRGAGPRLASWLAEPLPVAPPRRRRRLGRLLGAPRHLVRALLRAGRGAIATGLLALYSGGRRLERSLELSLRLSAWLRREDGDDDANLDRRPLPDELLRALLEADGPPQSLVDRGDARGELDQAFTSFRTSKGPGVVILVGNEGEGKHTLLKRWLAEHKTKGKTDRETDRETDGAAIVSVRLDERLTTAEDAVRWLAERLEIDGAATDATKLARQIDDRHRGKTLVLEDLQFAFLRRVDGFAALQCLLTVISTARQVFWLTSIHRPAWSYLTSLGGWVHTDVFHRVVELEPFAAADLRRLVEGRLAAAGFELDAGPLSDPRPRRGSQAYRRVITEYFRRLAWASDGNPTAALRLLRPTLGLGVEEGRVELGRYVEAAAPAELDDDALFLLQAIHTHRSLTAEELAEVMSLRAAAIADPLRRLEATGFLTTRQKRYSLAPEKTPAIVRALRRRHFLHGSAT